MGERGKGEDMNLTDRIIQFENGTLDEEGTIGLFQELVNSGLAWSLQGSYGRIALALLKGGHINPRPEATA